MLYVLGGFALLSGFLMLVYLFVNADPARLARGLKVTGIVIAVLAVATLAISGRLAALLMPIAMLMPLLIRVRSVLDRFRPPSGSQTSTVATPFLRMTLDQWRSVDERRRDRRGSLRDPRARARRRRRAGQGGASPADGQIASRSRRLGLSRDQNQPRSRRAVASLGQPGRRDAIEVAKVLADALIVDLPQARDFVVRGACLLRQLLGVVEFVHDAVVPHGDLGRRVLDDRRGRRTRGQREKARQESGPTHSADTKCHPGS